MEQQIVSTCSSSEQNEQQIIPVSSSSKQKEQQIVPVCSSSLTTTTSIKDLTPADTNQILETKVYRTWVATDFRTHSPIAFCCMLIDRQGDAVQGNADYKEYRTLSKILKPNAAYKLHGFTCKNTEDWQRTLPTPTTIDIGSHTNFEAIPAEGFPNHHFNFVDYETVQYRATHRIPILTDYIGRVHHVGEFEGGKRIISIMDRRNQVLPLLLWNEEGRNFDLIGYNNSVKPVIIAVSSCWANYYSKQLQLKGTEATHYYFNPDIDEYHATVEEYKNQETEEQSFILENNSTQTLTKLTTINASNHKFHRFFCECTIEKIDDKRPWFYLGCPQCKSKVADEIGKPMLCVKDGTPAEPLYCYSFRLIVTDGNTTAGITFMHSNGESLLGQSCKQLVVDMGFQNRREIPPPLLAMEKQTKVFRVRLNVNSKSSEHEFFGEAIVDQHGAGTSQAHISSASDSTQAPTPELPDAEDNELHTPPPSELPQLSTPATPSEGKNIIEKKFESATVSARRKRIVYEDEESDVADFKKKLN